MNERANREGHGHSPSGTDPQRAAGRSERLPAGRHGLSREVVASNQRERMLLAVAEASVANGYAATTVKDILERAGVSRKTFYEHFDDKEECFLAAYDVAVELLVARVTEADSDGAPWEERFIRGLADFLDVLAREPTLAAMCLVEGLAAGPAARQRLRVIVDRVRSFIDQGRAAESGGDEVPEPVSQAVASGITGVLYRQVAAGRAAELSELLPGLTYFALAPYVGVERARALASASSG